MVHNTYENLILDHVPAVEVPSPDDKRDIRILHVDDNPDTLMFTKMFLEEGRIIVDSTENPTEAMNVLTNGNYDCLVTDYMMPVMDGIQLSEMVRKTLDIPIIIYTGQGSEEVAEEAFKMGINDYLMKELNPSHLMVLAKRIETVVERHRAQMMVADSERRLRLTLDRMMEGCQIIDHEYRYLYLNEAAVRQARMDRDSLIGRTMMECYPGIEKTEMFHNIKTCMTERVHISMENHFTYPEGEMNWYMLNLEPVPEGVFILSIDIDGRKKAEHELKEKEETLRNTFKASPEALFVLGLDGVVQECNDAAVRLLGGNGVEDVVGHTYLEFIHPMDVEGAKLNLEETIKNGFFRNREYRLVDRGGQEIPILVSISVVYNDDGVPQGFVAAVQDITIRLKNIQRMKSLLLHSVELHKCESYEEVYVVTQRTMETTLGFQNPDILIVRNGYLVQLVGSRGLPDGYRLPLEGRGLTVKAVKEKQPVMVNDVRASQEFLWAMNEETGEPFPCYESTLSELSCPILVDGEAVGVLNVESPEINYFSENDLLMLQILASHVAEAIKRVRMKDVN